MKLGKRLIALVLSFVMIFGCIPSFVTESWATSTYITVTTEDGDLSLANLDVLDEGTVESEETYVISPIAKRLVTSIDDYPGMYFVDTIVESEYMDDIKTDIITSKSRTLTYNDSNITAKYIGDQIDNPLNYHEGEAAYFFEDDKLIIRELYDFGIRVTYLNEPTNNKNEQYYYQEYAFQVDPLVSCEGNVNLDFETNFMVSASDNSFLTRLVANTGIDSSKVLGKWLLYSCAVIDNINIDEYVLSINGQLPIELETDFFDMDEDDLDTLEDILKTKNLNKFYYDIYEDDEHKWLYFYKWYDFSISESISISSLTIGSNIGSINISRPSGQDIECLELYKIDYDKCDYYCASGDTLESGIDYMLALGLVGPSLSAVNSFSINGEKIVNCDLYNEIHDDCWCPAQINMPSIYCQSVYDCSDYAFLCTFYKFTAQTPIPTSKKYKASDSSSDGSADISGSGKKNSTRTITPDENKTVKEVIVTDKKGNPVDVIDNGDGTYSFKQPASDVVVEVIYDETEKPVEKVTTEQEEKLHEELLDTSDVKEVSSSSNKDKINTEATFIKGYDDGSFKPNEEVSNIELMSMVSELFNAEAKQGGESLDLNQGDNAWADDVISSCNKLGLVPGNKNSKNYDLSGSVSRGDLAIVIYDLVKDYTPSEKLKDTDSCSDVIGTKYEEAVTKLKELGILKGFDDNKYHYDLALSRAEAVVVINRALKALGVKMSASDINKSFGDLSKDHWAYDEIMNAAN